MEKYRYTIIVLIGFVLWWGNNIYFGFNDKPISNIETAFDITSWVFLLWGVFGDITTNIQVNKVTNINTPKDVKVINRK